MVQGAKGHTKMRRGMELKREQWERVASLTQDWGGRMKGWGLTEDGKKAR